MNDLVTQLFPDAAPVAAIVAGRVRHVGRSGPAVPSAQQMDGAGFSTVGLAVAGAFGCMYARNTGDHMHAALSPDCLRFQGACAGGVRRHRRDRRHIRVVLPSRFAALVLLGLGIARLWSAASSYRRYGARWPRHCGLARAAPSLLT